MASSKTVEVKSPRKLIEVALPLDKINAAASKEKSIRHGHPSTLHLWWARRPLAAARAVLFAQLVNDPGYERHLNRGVNKVEAVKERERLFKIIEDLVIWENTNNEAVVNAAREEIWKSWRETCELNRNHPDAATLFNPEKLPAFHDPFAGGGAIPLEAQRLGLESYASDLNPVAVTINKAMIEIPPRFAGKAPIGPIPPGEQQDFSQKAWPGATGLAEDVRRYGAWIRSEAEKRVGHLYPKIEITAEMTTDRPDLKALIGQKLTVVAWLWARTVKSPNPAYSHVEVPLVSTFVVSSKGGKEAYVEPIVDGDQYHFTVRMCKPTADAEAGTKAPGRGAAFRCLVSNAPISGDYIKAEGQAGRMGAKLLAIVAEGSRGRVYLEPTSKQEAVAKSAEPRWRPAGEVPARLTGGTCVPYGLRTWGDLFTPRQLVALNSFSELVEEAMEKCQQDALTLGFSSDQTPLNQGGSGAFAYGQSLAIYLAFSMNKMADRGSSICTWFTERDSTRNTFARQSLPMTWDYAELNTLLDGTGTFFGANRWTAESLEGWSVHLPQNCGSAVQCDAQHQSISDRKVVSTDPPYYDNIGYADLSDFFYVWLRKVLRPIYPELYATMVVPKQDELVASSYRHGGKKEAESFFLNGMTEALHNLAELSHPAFPVTIYYAFKQSDTDGDDATSSSGWVTFLEAVSRSGFALNGTWPMRTELSNRMIGSGTNALASSIVLVCRKRNLDAPTISRREFLRELHAVLPDSLIDMTRGGVNSPVAPVDLSQAIIGPGMGIFSKYKAVLEADGTPMTVRTALQLINRFLADDDFDPETQFCLQWFETNYWKPGQYGIADVAARAKGTSVDGLFRAGVLNSGGGEVQLLRWNELPTDWKPDPDHPIPVWEALHQLIRNLNMHGEQAAGTLLARMSTVSGPVRTLAYRLYTLCERKGLAEDARPYNELIGSWAAIEVVADEIGPIEKQGELF
jgi:putative DNA methylase